MMSPGEKRVLIALLIVWAIAAPFLFLLYRGLQPSPDQSIFDYIAWISSQGQPPYRGAFEVNWPGQMLVHMVAHSLFGTQSEAARSFDYLIMQASALAGFGMLWRSGFRAGSGLMLALYPPIYVTLNVWMCGQRDIVAGEILLIACLCLAGPRRSLPGLLVAGALMAFAAAIRPTYLAFLAGVLLLELFWPADAARHPNRRRSVTGILGGAGIVVAGFVILGIATGSLEWWYLDAIRYALECYGAGPPPQSMTGVPVELFLHSWPWITALALGGLLCWALRADVNRYPLLLSLGAIATAVLSFIVQHKGFNYHLGGILPVLILFIAVLADTLARAGNRSVKIRAWIGPWARFAPPLYQIALAALLLFVAAGTVLKLRHAVEPANAAPLKVALIEEPAESCEGTPVATRAAAYIASHVPASATVLPLNCGYRAAYLAHRLPASRFATSTAFGGNPRRCAIGDRFLATYAADIAARKPALILTSATLFDASSPLLKVRPGSGASAQRAAVAAAGYQRVAQFGEMLLYAPPGAQP